MLGSKNRMASNKRPRISDDGADGAALAKNIAPVVTTGRSTSAACTSTSSVTTNPLPHGTFTGRSIYRNRIGPKETVVLGHVSLQHLVPDATQQCLCTTFISAGSRWMEETRPPRGWPRQRRNGRPVRPMARRNGRPVRPMARRHASPQIFTSIIFYCFGKY